MSTPDILSLRWNNHKTTFFKLLSAIHIKSQFEDATVACSGKLFPVHRLVLSCCSNYFEQMFAQTQGKHSIIVLKDISAEVFHSLLSYMYIGEAEVRKDLLSDLLVAAHALEIKGLAISDEEDLQQVPSVATSASKEKTIVKAANEFPKKRPSEENQQGYSAKIQKMGDNTLSSSDCLNRSLPTSSTPNTATASSTGYQSQYSKLCLKSSSAETEHASEESESSNPADGQLSPVYPCRITCTGPLLPLRTQPAYLTAGQLNAGLIEIKEEIHEQQQNTDKISFMASSAPGGEGSNNVQANQASAAHQLVNMSQVTPAALVVSCSRAIPNNRLQDPSVSIPPDWNPSKQIPLFPDNSTLEVFLMRSRMGSVLTDAYHIKQNLTTIERSKLVALIIDGLLERFDSLRNCHLAKIAEDLVRVFPTEVKISPSLSDRSRGFLSEGFVRPPVDVDVTFSAPVDMYHVIFSTVVQCKQSIAFALFASPQTSLDSELIRIGLFNTNKENTLHLTNARLHRWYRYPQQLKVMKLAQYDRSATTVFEGKLRHADPETLKNVRRLRIRILRNASTGGSGLAGLEVWGRPGAMASKEERVAAIDGWGQHYVLHFINNTSVEALGSAQSIADAQANAKYDFYCDMFKQISDIIPDEEKPIIPNESEKCNDEGKLLFPDNDAETSDVPEEYLDPITCSLMVTPMLLPSGNSVDITTLEKFNSSQRVYNRPPCDPFTGIAFNALVQPVPNTRLKARIDRFVLLNQRDPALHDVGRSLLPVPALTPGDQSPNLLATRPRPPSSQESTCADDYNNSTNSYSQVARNRRDRPGESNRKGVAGGSASGNCNNSIRKNNRSNRSSIKASSETGSIECIEIDGDPDGGDDAHCNNIKRKKISEFTAAATNLGQATSSGSSDFVRKFRAVNANNFQPNITSSSTDTPLPSGGHSGLPQLVTRPRRSTVIPLSSVASSQGRNTRPVLCNSFLAQPPSSSVPLSRSLLNAKPIRLIQGDAEPPQFSAFSQEALLKGDDRCPKCGSSDQLYVLETCRHLLCRGCFGLEQSTSGSGEVTCSVCSASVLRKNVSRHHSKSVFSR